MRTITLARKQWQCAILQLEAKQFCLLNHSTDGVSCEMDWNRKSTLEYLQGKSNQLSFPDTNHNVKNCRYQMIGGSCAAVLGMFCFDPWSLKIAGVAQELIRIDDFASDAVVLRLASANTITKVVDLDCNDVGNLALTVVSLLFMRMRVYATNAIEVPWKERAAYSWSSLLWFTSFHHSGGTTMLPNKQNMLLESVGLVFLVPRNDVCKPRMLTDECNEHTFGGWRSSKREFNVDQVMLVEEKRRNQTKAIFEGNLQTMRSKHELKGYQETFQELDEGSKSSPRSENVVPVEVDLNKSEVDK
jgi:hypothetical protein